ncbi:pantoate--beta-alanine ligase [Deinococcus peraridilitoris]|uniref:Pantothenate synthetase n=1 Tax=Deinococcus peraridilitoris (strain DSM 19664 / LMG 22246 / CIP 109416 / KR-200) TaxID=937777 RepID=L0A384_DEIPD|nr:pantoate--beta-alanine ligase [Deinococcus peraridilitoris]AFZ68306.1 pantoate--beta-alanine ligase [Deinococcus peraridilitoris DSM 19664]
MELIQSPVELRARLVGAASVGFVPTMGFLHDGHARLIERASQENERVVVSVFVNPLQFGAGEDLSRYPRDLARDQEIAEQHGAHLLFHPQASVMYPEGFTSRIELGGPGEGWEGASRPGHFSGVATVVLKLLNLVSPTRAYFGEKDWQQLAVIRRVVRDFNLSVEIVGCPTVREPSGLALSSRNSYFTAEQRERAAILSRALRAAQNAYAKGERLSKRLLDTARMVLMSERELTLDYLALVDENLRPIEVISRPEGARLLIAACLFGVRLIDNMPLSENAHA